MMIQHAKLYLLGLILALAAGCASVGLQSPRNLQDQVMYGYGTLSAVYSTVADLSTRGAITQPQAVTAVAQADTAKASLDAARTALWPAAGVPADQNKARAALQVATGILTALQTQLKAQGAK